MSLDYLYANNSNGQLIHVSQSEKGEVCYCPVCGCEMIPHKGQKRRWHFVHKNMLNCSHESYLHYLAKIKLREAFLSTKDFSISYEVVANCNRSKDCPLYSGINHCISRKPVRFNLRDYYDSCEIEATYKEFKADLLLTSTQNPNRPPIFIEIFVTHKCSEEKIGSGVRIIEIPISSEMDIQNILDRHGLKCIQASDMIYVKTEAGKSTLYNFNNKEQFDPVDEIERFEEFGKNTKVLCLDKNGKFYKKESNCFQIENDIPKDVHYFAANYLPPFKVIFQEFNRNRIKIRNCFICQFCKTDYSGERICVLYRKYNLPRKPSPYAARECQYFRVDENYKCPKGEIEKAYPNLTYDVHICEDIL